MTLRAVESLARRLSELYRFERSHMRPGVAGVSRLLARCGNPERAFPSILIAGTNGKGSTAAYTAAILRAAGLNVGLFTSPHLIRFSERIRIGGEEISDDALERLLGRFWPWFQEESPSFFEAATALAFTHFADAGVDAAVVEVGLGGRLDATNVLTPRVSVITTIASDHEEILGTSRRGIALEKAGIVKPGQTLAIGVRPGDARDAILDVAASRGVPVSILGRDARVRVRRVGAYGTEFWLASRTFRGVVETPLPGLHQARNAALAALAAEAFLDRLGDRDLARAIGEGIVAVRWPARAESVGSNPPILVDVAHNVEGARAIADTVRAIHGDRPVAVVVGFACDKAHGSILRALGRVAGSFFLTEFAGDRAAPASILRSAAPAAHLLCHAIPDLKEALDRARIWAIDHDGVVLVTGSLYLVGQALPLLEADVPRAI